ENDINTNNLLNEGIYEWNEQKRQLHYFIILIIMLVIEYKIYNKDFKNFIDNIDDSQLCIGVYIRFYDIIEGKIHIKCYSFSLDEDYYHVKSIIRIRCSDDFSEGLLLEENKFFNKESEITFSEKLKNIKTKNKIDNIEKINETDTIVISVYIVENYFEYKIENFSEFLNEINERSNENFEVGNYKWKISIKTFFNDTSKEYNNIGIILENMDNFDNLEECITCKYLFYIKSSDKYYYSFKPSSLSVFNNAKKKSEYLIINKELYNKSIKSFINNDNSLTIGIYIYIYDNFIIKSFINDIRDKGIDNEYEIINNNYSEWEIDDWDKLQKENITTISSPLFTEKKYYWNVTFFPKEENFSQILYFTSNYNNNENNNIYLRCIFVIRNCNDFSCYEIQKSKISSLEYNMELRNDTVEDNIILPIKALKSYEISKRHLIENNKVIFGVYIFKMKKKERK
ncbi:hypothetical protein H8356DRAFT_1718566, partial [Neocallimastix lanati (nom. inval.)]